MSNGIAPLASLQSTEPVTAAGARGGAIAGTVSTQADSTATQAPPRPNPSFRIDAALGLVVLEFRNWNGQVSTSIPTAQQLDAYRRAAGASHSATPSHGHATSAAAGSGAAGTSRIVSGTSAPGSAAVAAPTGSRLAAASAAVAVPPHAAATP